MGWQPRPVERMTPGQATQGVGLRARLRARPDSAFVSALAGSATGTGLVVLVAHVLG